MYIRNEVTLAQVRAAKPTRIFYAVHTCWWTHDPADLSKHPTSGLPCDPRGSVLFQSDNAEEFLQVAESNPGHYGKHGLRTFMAAHAKNCVINLFDPLPWSAGTWNAYEEELDRQDAEARSLQMLAWATDAEEVRKCGNCGAWRTLRNGNVERCKVCGDDEIYMGWETPVA